MSHLVRALRSQKSTLKYVYVDSVNRYKAGFLHYVCAFTTVTRLVGKKPVGTVVEVLDNLATSNVSMVVSCYTYGCRNRFGEIKGLGFYCIPVHPNDRRERWIIAIKRVNWKPSKHARICGDHFESGMRVSIKPTVCFSVLHVCTIRVFV